MQLSIIVVSYNTADLTIQSLKSVIHQLSATTNWSPSETEIFVVDNASQDESVSQVTTLLKKSNISHQIIANTQNVGFAQANNQAFKLTRGQWLWLLNSDTKLMPQCLNYLFQATQTVPNHVGLISPSLLNADLTAQNTGGDLPSLMTLFCQFWFLDDIPVLGPLLPSVQKNHLDPHRWLVYRGWLPGTALLMRSTIYETLGGLDEQFFMYAEDIEYCWRAQRSRYLAIVVPKAKIVHLQSASSDKSAAYKGEFLGLRDLCDQNLSHWQKPLARFILISGAVMRAIIFGTIKGDKPKGKVYWEITRLLLK